MMVNTYEQTEKLHNNYTHNKIENPAKIRMLDTCRRNYLKLTKKNITLQHRIESILEELKLRPYMGQKLVANFPGCRSIHFNSNSYRIVYKVLDKPKYEILILDIEHRSSSYTHLAKILGQGK